MELKKARKLAKKLMREHGLYFWFFSFYNNYKAKGRCHPIIPLIQLNSEYVKANKEELVRNTILHEIAHALLGRKRFDHQHDDVWKELALNIGWVTPNQL